MKHHFVPQFYLRAFVDPNTPLGQTPHLWIADLNAQTTKRRAPENAATLTDYYAIQDEAGATDHEVEAFLSGIESNASKVISEIVGGRVDLTATEREHLALMAAMQVVRVPAFRDRIEAFLGEVGETLFQMIASDPERFRRDVRASGAEKGKTDEEIEELRKAALSGEAFSFRGHPMASLNHALTAAFDVVGPMVLEMDWGFVKAPAGAAFITSDKPAFWHNPKARGFYGRGLGARDAELAYPLGPQVMLLGNWQGVVGASQADADQMRTVNRLVAAYAKQFVFAASEDAAREALQARPSPTQRNDP